MCLPAAGLSQAVSFFSNQEADANCETRCLLTQDLFQRKRILSALSLVDSWVLLRRLRAASDNSSPRAGRAWAVVALVNMQGLELFPAFWKVSYCFILGKGGH